MTPAIVQEFGLACPACNRRGLMRVARLLYRCLPCDQDFELPSLLHRIMETAPRSVPKAEAGGLRLVTRG